MEHKEAYYKVHMRMSGFISIPDTETERGAESLRGEGGGVERRLVSAVAAAPDVSRGREREREQSYFLAVYGDKSVCNSPDPNEAVVEEGDIE